MTDDLRQIFPDVITSIITAYHYPCQRCYQVRHLLTTYFYQHDNELYTEAVNTWDEYTLLRLDYMPLVGVVDCFFRVENGTCEKCPDYSLGCRQVETTVDQIVMVLAHRLDISHIFNDMEYTQEQHLTLPGGQNPKFYDRPIDNLSLQLSSILTDGHPLEE
jgi:hypothetical protein